MTPSEKSIPRYLVGWSLACAAGPLLVLAGACGGANRAGDDAAAGESASRPRSKAEWIARAKQRRGGSAEGSPGALDPGAAPPIPVVVTRAALADMEAFLDASSTLEAERDVTVVSQATGVVAELHAEEGDRVRKGQTLLRLAYEELELAERRARTELERLKADFARAEALAREQLISEEEYQRVKFDRQRAELEWEQAKLALDHTRVIAPISGTVTERRVNVGELVQTNQPVYRIVDFDSLVAPVHIPERYLPDLRPAQRAVVEPRGLGRRLEARILRISPVVDAQSGTVRVLLSLEDKRELRPGMFANVRIVLDTHRDVVVVPKRALVFEEEAPHLFVVREGKAERRRVRLGYQDAERAEIADGLQRGETVVVVGQSALKDGSAVVVQQEEPPAGAAARKNARATPTPWAP